MARGELAGLVGLKHVEVPPLPGDIDTRLPGYPIELAALPSEHQTLRIGCITGDVHLVLFKRERRGRDKPAEVLNREDEQVASILIILGHDVGHEQIGSRPVKLSRFEEPPGRDVEEGLLPP